MSFILYDFTYVINITVIIDIIIIITVSWEESSVRFAVIKWTNDKNLNIKF